MKTRAFYLLLLLLIIHSCTSKGQSHKEGQIAISFQMQNTITGEKGSDMPATALFRESLLVETKLLYKEITLHNTTTYSTSLVHYLFIDLRKGLVYKYKSFSDTAALMDIYPITDSGRTYRDGMSHYFRMEPIPYLRVESEGKDTLVDGTWYKRDIVWKQDRQYVFREIHLHRCDLPNKLFTLGSYGLANDDCPLVKRLVYGTTGSYPYFVNELNYVADSLTTEQRKVFDAWEQMADCNAVLPKLPYISPFPKPVSKYVDLRKK